MQGRQGGHSRNCNNKSNKSLYKCRSQPQLTRENLKARVGEAFSASAAGTRPLAQKGISLGILSVYFRYITPLCSLYVYFVSTYQQQRWLNRSFDLGIQTIVILNIFSLKIPDFAPNVFFVLPSYFVYYIYKHLNYGLFLSFFFGVMRRYSLNLILKKKNPQIR